MLQGWHPIWQAAFGTLFTWGLTAAGSALVFIFSSGQRRILDGSLGFAAGVMTAASYWSLLAPAIEAASQSGTYGKDGEWAFIPVAIGFILGAAFVYGADVIMPWLGIADPMTSLALETSGKFDKDGRESSFLIEQSAIEIGEIPAKANTHSVRQRGYGGGMGNRTASQDSLSLTSQPRGYSSVTWKRIFLLIVAITIHNIPEGLAVGVGFGAIGKSKSATFEKARNLAIGIGIQNFPEGLAVSLPLRGSGMSVFKSFWYGQLSGMVEPIAGIIGAFAVVVAEPLLPYALAFAAGAMIYVVVDDIVPEAHTAGNGKLASAGAVVGFVVMMCLDVGLG